MDEWIGQWMSGSVNGQMDWPMDEWIGQWMNGSANLSINRSIDWFVESMNESMIRIQFSYM